MMGKGEPERREDACVISVTQVVSILARRSETMSTGQGQVLKNMRICFWHRLCLLTAATGRSRQERLPELQRHGS
jgi:hypothetical protein